jgi:hypothetical protein
MNTFASYRQAKMVSAWVQAARSKGRDSPVQHHCALAEEGKYYREDVQSPDMKLQDSH